MKILVLVTDDRWNELPLNNTAIEWTRSENIHSFLNNKDTDAYFNLTEEACKADYSSVTKPVFINSVTVTLREMTAAENVYRINGWNGFIKRDSWEIAGNMNETVLAMLTKMGKHPVIVPDEPGFIAARIISMIINEAYFAKAENVSSENEIDTAMKLGTNYPFGPFEWSKLIGIGHIYSLLKKLGENDARYKPSSLLEQEAIERK